MDKQKYLNGYSVGPLMYSPVKLHGSIVDALRDESYPRPFSLAFCLEDTVSEDAVEAAENDLFSILRQIGEEKKKSDFYLPLIFVRIRSPKQLKQLSERYAPLRDVLTGFILPKFFIDNCDEYVSVIGEQMDYGYWYMPIFESEDMVPLHTRYADLALVKEKLQPVSKRILNIRVGGNDLSNVFGLRRSVKQSIYDVRPVSNLLIDVLTVFSPDYIVSGPVWEYYAGEGWDEGLRHETELDLANGFIGKTVIHPNQIPVVNEVLKVRRADYEDAKKILNWEQNQTWLVSASAEGTRMNEYKTHWRWAEKILFLARNYGVKED